MNAVKITGENLTIDDLFEVAEERKTIELSEGSLEKVKNCRQMLEEKFNNNETMYGINTGIGEFSEVKFTPDQSKEYQRNLVYSHAAGIGENMPKRYVRAAMVSRLNVLMKGYSGCRPEIIHTMMELLNKGVTPVVCKQGSVGACGDLAPMSQIALVFLGEGKAEYKGKIYTGEKALKLANIDIPYFEIRDGLSLINGSNFITSISALLTKKIEEIIVYSEYACALVLEALLANSKPFDSRLHQLRGFRGAVTSAQKIFELLEESDLLHKIKVKVQDAYSLRSTPQVTGSVRDMLEYCKAQINIELNGVGDNPIFLTEERETLTGANFQGTPISYPMESISSGLTMLSVISERRLNRLLHPALNAGLPPFLATRPGFDNGMMLSQYTSGTLMVDNKVLSSPSCFSSISAAGDQEDFVSMGMNSILNLEKIVENCFSILGLELMAAAQAIEFREHKLGKGTKIIYDNIRNIIEPLKGDRPLYNDHNAIASYLKGGDLIANVSKAYH